MTASEYFAFLVDEIHSTVVATVDEDGRPSTCVIDMMDWDENGVYFLTARGKGFYERLSSQRFVSISGMKGDDTLSCVALTVKGSVREEGPGRLGRLFEKNPYMKELYSESSRSALTVFCLYKGVGEWFDLSKKPGERRSFSFGGASVPEEGYFVTDSCIGCKLCYSKCPQKCIDVATKPAVIDRQHCLHCGNCFEICPVRAVEKRGRG